KANWRLYARQARPVLQSSRIPCGVNFGFGLGISSSNVGGGDAKTGLEETGWKDGNGRERDGRERMEETGGETGWKRRDEETDWKRRDGKRRDGRDGMEETGWKRRDGKRREWKRRMEEDGMAKNEENGMEGDRDGRGKSEPCCSQYILGNASAARAANCGAVFWTRAGVAAELSGLYRDLFESTLRSSRPPAVEFELPLSLSMQRKQHRQYGPQCLESDAAIGGAAFAPLAA
uniref:Octapeptide-repeat protein T2 n=1 Tax=Macrostomum lignano TaxID=282301 RepID=A0A1I8F8F6_9PLAT